MIKYLKYQTECRREKAKERNSKRNPDPQTSNHLIRTIEGIQKVVDVNLGNTFVVWLEKKTGVDR